MALVILSTIASALSISGRERYICDWKGVGMAKGLLSELGYGWGLITQSGMYMRTVFLVQSLCNKTFSTPALPDACTRCQNGPIPKCRKNRQKTVLPLPRRFEIMNHNQKASGGRSRPSDRIEGDKS